MSRVAQRRATRPGTGTPALLPRRQTALARVLNLMGMSAPEVM